MNHNSNYGEVPTHDLTSGPGLPVIDNPKQKEISTVTSTARTMKRVREGKMTEEDLNYCLEINSKNIGYSVEALRTAAENELRSQIEESDVQEETNTPKEPQM